MNKLIDWIISSLKYMVKKYKLNIIKFYNETSFSINKNSTLNKMYKPIIAEKVDTNKKLQKTINILAHQNKEAEHNTLKLEKENALLQDKITIIQDLMTKRHD